MRGIKPFEPHKGLHTSVRDIAQLKDDENRFRRSFDAPELAYKNESINQIGDFLLLILEAMRQYKTGSTSTVSISSNTTVIRNNIKNIVNNFRAALSTSAPRETALLIERIGSTFSGNTEIGEAELSSIISELETTINTFGAGTKPRSADLGILKSANLSGSGLAALKKNFSLIFAQSNEQIEKLFALSKSSSFSSLNSNNHSESNTFLREPSIKTETKTEQNELTKLLSRFGEIHLESLSVLKQNRTFFNENTIRPSNVFSTENPTNINALQSLAANNYSLNNRYFGVYSDNELFLGKSLASRFVPRIYNSVNSPFSTAETIYAEKNSDVNFENNVSTEAKSNTDLSKNVSTTERNHSDFSESYISKISSIESAMESLSEYSNEIENIRDTRTNKLLSDIKTENTAINKEYSSIIKSISLINEQKTIDNDSLEYSTFNTDSLTEIIGKSDNVSLSLLRKSGFANTHNSLSLSLLQRSLKNGGSYKNAFFASYNEGEKTSFEAVINSSISSEKNTFIPVGNSFTYKTDFSEQTGTDFESKQIQTDINPVSNSFNTQTESLTVNNKGSQIDHSESHSNNSATLNQSNSLTDAKTSNAFLTIGGGNKFASLNINTNTRNTLLKTTLSEAKTSFALTTENRFFNKEESHISNTDSPFFYSETDGQTTKLFNSKNSVIGEFTAFFDSVINSNNLFENSSFDEKNASINTFETETKNAPQSLSVPRQSNTENNEFITAASGNLIYTENQILTGRQQFEAKTTAQYLNSFGNKSISANELHNLFKAINNSSTSKLGSFTVSDNLDMSNEISNSFVGIIESILTTKNSIKSTANMLTNSLEQTLENRTTKPFYDNSSYSYSDSENVNNASYLSELYSAKKNTKSIFSSAENSLTYLTENNTELSENSETPSDETNIHFFKQKLNSLSLKTNALYQNLTRLMSETEASLSQSFTDINQTATTAPNTDIFSTVGAVKNAFSAAITAHLESFENVSNSTSSNAVFSKLFVKNENNLNSLYENFHNQTKKNTDITASYLKNAFTNSFADIANKLTYANQSSFSSEQVGEVEASEKPLSDNRPNRSENAQSLNINALTRLTRSADIANDYYQSLINLSNQSIINTLAEKALNTVSTHSFAFSDNILYTLRTENSQQTFTEAIAEQASTAEPIYRFTYAEKTELINNAVLQNRLLEKLLTQNEKAQTDTTSTTNTQTEAEQETIYSDTIQRLERLEKTTDSMEARSRLIEKLLVQNEKTTNNNTERIAADNTLLHRALTLEKSTADTETRVRLIQKLFGQTERLSEKSKTHSTEKTNRELLLAKPSSEQNALSKKSQRESNYNTEKALINRVSEIASEFYTARFYREKTSKAQITAAQNNYKSAINLSARDYYFKHLLNNIFNISSTENRSGTNVLFPAYFSPVYSKLIAEKGGKTEVLRDGMVYIAAAKTTEEGTKSLPVKPDESPKFGGTSEPTQEASTGAESGFAETITDRIIDRRLREFTENELRKITENATLREEVIAESVLEKLEDRIKLNSRIRGR